MTKTAIQASHAYSAASEYRGLREQEADVFLRIVGALRASQRGDVLARIRAMADNSRLWSAVTNILRDQANALPAELRASIISVGAAVQREMNKDAPDLEFLISVNENIAQGLLMAGRADC